MAKCKHNFEPSDRCPTCKVERHDQQFGGIHSGEVGLSYQGKPTTKLNLKEAKEERAEDYDPIKKDEAMAEFVKKSFTTELEEEENGGI